MDISCFMSQQKLYPFSQLVPQENEYDRLLRVNRKIKFKKTEIRVENWITPAGTKAILFQRNVIEIEFGKGYICIWLFIWSTENSLFITFQKGRLEYMNDNVFVIHRNRV